MGHTPPDMQEMVIPEPRGEYLTYAITKDYTHETVEQPTSSVNIVSAQSHVNETNMGLSDNAVYSVSTLCANQAQCITTPSVTAQGAITNMVAPSKTLISLSPVKGRLESSAQACLDAILPNPILQSSSITNSTLQERVQSYMVHIPEYISVIQGNDQLVNDSNVNETSLPKQNLVISQPSENIQSHPFGRPASVIQHIGNYQSNISESRITAEPLTVQPPPIIQVIVVNGITAPISDSEHIPKLCPIAPAPRTLLSTNPCAQGMLKGDAAVDPGPIRRRSFVCLYEDCKKMYYKSSHLKAHIRVHTGGQNINTLI